MPKLDNFFQNIHKYVCRELHNQSHSYPDGKKSLFESIIGKVFRYRKRSKKVGKTTNFIDLFGTQCNVYMMQRLKRLHKVYLLYQQAYNDYAKVFLFYPIIRRFASKRPLTFALAACGFQWQNEGFSDADMQQQVNDLMTLQKVLGCDTGDSSVSLPSFWQNILCEPEIKVWKYPRVDLGLTEYKVHGTFTDISARMFFNIQVDMDYRKKWDDLVVKLDVVDQNRSCDEQVLQWVTGLPYPFAPREYLCIRRTLIDEKNKVMVISAKAVSQHPSCPPSKNYVRVTSYVSHMVIKPHKSFDELGFDYLMTYCDDPQLVLPTRLSSWVISAGVPEYINKLHNACLKFRKKSNEAQNLPEYIMS